MEELWQLKSNTLSLTRYFDPRPFSNDESRHDRWVVPLSSDPNNSAHPDSDSILSPDDALCR